MHANCAARLALRHAWSTTRRMPSCPQVPRRLKIVPPDTPYFSVRRVLAAGKDDSSKVAAGMEVSFIVTFRPESTEDYAYNLVVCTEREKFVVPVIAAGAAPALDVPDLVEFEPTPVKMATRQTLLVRNVGTSGASFALSAPLPFGASPSRGFLQPGETLQVQLSFCPDSCQRYSGELEVAFSNGQAVYSQLSGAGRLLDVGVSQPAVQLLPTYVTKMSQKSFRIVNNADVAVTYAVKARAAPADDTTFATARLDALNASVGAGGGGGRSRQRGGADADVSEDEDEILGSVGASQRERLKAAQRDVLLDAQMFGDANFSCSPAEGTLWPHSEVEVIVQFTPDFTRDYEVTAYVDVQGASDRIPVLVRGTGLGPLAVFSYDVLDVGQAFCGVVHTYDVELQNRGKIDVNFSLVPPTSVFGAKFGFEPDAGHLAGGEIQIIRVRLCSDVLGNFCETFKWAIAGSASPVELQLTGHVTGPSYEIDAEVLDFGLCSFGFRYTKELTLTNTCDIPMRFGWRVPADKDGPDREFHVVPARGQILPGGRQKVTVEFVSHSVQRYTGYVLALDIPIVGDGVACVPMEAECVVPRLSLSAQVLEFGECYLRHPYTRKLRVINESKLPAKFEVLPQEPQSTGLAVFEVGAASAGVAALDEADIPVSLKTFTLGRVQIPLRVRVLGSRGKPLECAIDARSLGPSLLFGPAGARTPGMALDFGRVPVLSRSSLPLALHNPTPIPASFKLFVESADSSFAVEPEGMVLGPGESGEAVVHVRLDEAAAFADQLHVLVAEGADMPVPLTAVGSGNVLVSEELHGDTLDFGHQFVGRQFGRAVTVHNMGRKPVTLTWTSAAAEQVKKAFAKTARTQGNKFDMTLVPVESQVWDPAPAGCAGGGAARALACPGRMHALGACMPWLPVPQEGHSERGKATPLRPVPRCTSA
eukprot:357809-Chlamydomonas_euryale.AAC.3